MKVVMKNYRERFLIIINFILITIIPIAMFNLLKLVPLATEIDFNGLIFIIIFISLALTILIGLFLNWILGESINEITSLINSNTIDLYETLYISLIIALLVSILIKNGENIMVEIFYLIVFSFISFLIYKKLQKEEFER